MQQQQQQQQQQQEPEMTALQCVVSVIEEGSTQAAELYEPPVPVDVLQNPSADPNGGEEGLISAGMELTHLVETPSEQAVDISLLPQHHPPPGLSIPMNGPVEHPPRQESESVLREALYHSDNSSSSEAPMNKESFQDLHEKFGTLGGQFTSLLIV